MLSQSRYKYSSTKPAKFLFSRIASITFTRQHHFPSSSLYSHVSQKMSEMNALPHNATPSDMPNRSSNVHLTGPASSATTTTKTESIAEKNVNTDKKVGRLSPLRLPNPLTVSRSTEDHQRPRNQGRVCQRCRCHDDMFHRDTRGDRAQQNAELGQHLFRG